MYTRNGGVLETAVDWSNPIFVLSYTPLFVCSVDVLSSLNIGCLANRRIHNNLGNSPHNNKKTELRSLRWRPPHRTC